MSTIKLGPYFIEVLVLKNRNPKPSNIINIRIPLVLKLL